MSTDTDMTCWRGQRAGDYHRSLKHHLRSKTWTAILGDITLYTEYNQAECRSLGRWIRWFLLG